MKRYQVLLPIDVGGAIHHPGEVIDLDEETAAAYAHALAPVKEENHHARHS